MKLEELEARNPFAATAPANEKMQQMIRDAAKEEEAAFESLSDLPEAGASSGGTPYDVGSKDAAAEEEATVEKNEISDEQTDRTAEKLNKSKGWPAKKREKQKRAEPKFEELSQKIIDAENLLDSLNKQVDQLRRDAENYQEQISKSKEVVRTKQKQAEAIMQSASEAAAKQTAEANSYEQDVYLKAEQKKQRILSEAHEEEDRILASAKEKKQGIIMEAMTEAQAKIKTCLPDYEEKVNRSVAEKMQNISEKQRNVSTDLQTAKNSVENEMNRLNSSFRKMLDEYSTAITESLKTDFLNYKHDLAASLNDPINAIFRVQFESLAHVFHNVRLILSEVEKRQRDYREASALIDQESDSYALQDELFQKWSQFNENLLDQIDCDIYNLRKLRDSFANAMSALGIYEFLPESGGLFDDYEHESVNKDIDPYGRRIRHTIYSGLKIKSVCDEEDAVLLKATVELEETKNG